VRIMIITRSQWLFVNEDKNTIPMPEFVRISSCAQGWNTQPVHEAVSEDKNINPV
jgi:hypothetical protein